MNKIIPILPCPSIKEQVSFYEALGFATVQAYNRPNPYAVMRYGTLEVHFYGSKKTVPHENPQMCYIRVDDVEQVYEHFTSSLKGSRGSIPRSGIPRISKLKYLNEDKRFLITDLGGNTLFIGTPNSDVQDPAFYRTLESEEHAEPFAILYDLLYSKEDSQSAYNMLAKFFPADVAAIPVGGLDLAKILLVALDIHIHRNRAVDQALNAKLKELIAGQSEHGDWSKIIRQYNDIVPGE